MAATGGKPLLEGWLAKRGPTVDYKWQCRWCVLYPQALEYYADEDRLQKKGVVFLRNTARVVTFEANNAPGDVVKHRSQMPFGFVLDVDPSAGRQRRLFYFDARGSAALQAWMDALGRAFELMAKAGSEMAVPLPLPRPAEEQVLSAVEGGDSRALLQAPDELRENRDFALAAVTKNGQALAYVAEGLREDKDVVLAAVQQDGAALEHAPEALKSDRDVVLRAVSQNGRALRHSVASLQGDREIVLAAVLQSPDALEFASKELQEAEDLVVF